MFTAQRLTLARERRGLTKRKLAEIIGVTERSVISYESGEAEPSTETLSRLARALSFPEGFFSAPEAFVPAVETVSFRSLARMTAQRRNAAIGASSIAIMLNDWIENNFDLPPVNVPDLRGHDPEIAADMLRKAWNMDQYPIKNMVHLMEANGVRVYSLADQSPDADALSFWYNDIPFVSLNTNKSGERGRFDAAHELGHIVLHRHGGPIGQDAEKEAHAFAAAFLMPRASVLGTAPQWPTLEHIVNHKKYWSVSAFAYVVRLKNLNLITEWHYTSLCKELAKQGYRTREKDGIQREVSQLLAKVFAALREDGISKAHVSDELNINIDELDSHIFGLVLTSVTGGGNRSASSSVRDQLTLVTGGKS